MRQLSMLVTDPDTNSVRVRHDAPATSREAAAGAFPNSGTGRKTILGAIWRSGPYGATRDELADRLRMTPNTVRPRVKELLDAGWIEQDGRTRPSAAGRSSEVLILSAIAYIEINRRMAA